MLTLLEETTRVRDDRPAYRPYAATVKTVTPLTPSFVRVTFTGDGFATFGSAGLDQRIKLLLPLDGRDPGYDCLAGGAAGWYDAWRALPGERRNPIRTYTVRAIRQHERELDVDFALHGDGGPASRWARRARAGDELVIVGPDDLSTGWRIGLDFRPGAADDILLVGDETAAPAICSILESLDTGVRATAFVEVPHESDALSDHPAITWIAREGGPRGIRLEAAARAWLLAHPALASASAPQPLDESDADGLVWDSPAGPDHGGFYAWIAGETSSVVRLHRFLVRELGVDRSRVAFMGYWRDGIAEQS